jgi:heme exporter protein B
MIILLDTIRRDLLLHLRRPADILNPLVFFLIVVSLFPMGIGPTESVLSSIAAGVIWVAVLLATLLSIDVMFKGDYDDGTLEQIVLGKQSLLVIVFGKVIAQWLVSGFLMALISPLFAMMFYVPVEGMIAIAVALLLGTPTMTLLGSIGAALTLGLKNGGVLIAILVLPLYIPVLILGTAMVESAIFGNGYTGHMLWLAVLLVLSIGFAPLVTQAGIRISLSH